MRISIIGHSSSGKSTLAHKISEKFHIPHLHIDRFWFESGGRNVDPNDKENVQKVRTYMEEKVTDFIKQESWVADGWYWRIENIIVNHVDQIIFLDIPLYRRLLNHLKRIFTTERHKELTKWDELKFFYEIISRTFTKNKRLRQFVRAHSDKVKTFKNYREVEKYFNSL